MASYGLLTCTLRGVFLSEEPLDVNEGAQGDKVLEIELPGAVEVYDKFEVVEHEKPYREWCVPAVLLNEQGRVRLLAEAEVEQVLDALFRERHPDLTLRDLPGATGA